METTTKQAAPTRPKRKRKSQLTIATSEHKVKILEQPDSVAITTHMAPVSSAKIRKSPAVKRKAEAKLEDVDVGDKYPLLKNQDLVSQFLKVQMTNNQKGRIRQAVKESLQGTSNVMEPDIIHNKIQSILTNSPQLNDAELRRIRILYNLLKTALKDQQAGSEDKEGVKTKKLGKHKKKVHRESLNAKDKVTDEKTEKLATKVRGPKRYVVFLGNLPLDVNKHKITKHFSEMNEHIVDIRIPKAEEGKKSAIAYLEVSNEPSYEFALSKHHSMLGKKRINVLYTAPKKGKITKDKAKSKSAKLIALQKAGKLVGSVPLAKKRSQRRLKQKKAQAAELAAKSA